LDIEQVALKLQTDTEIKSFRDTLANGLTVVAVEMPHIHMIEVAMFVRAGLRFENEKNNGISHFLEHMMFRGNRKYPDSISLNLEFEKIGRDLRASTLSEYTYYGFSPHYDQLERGMELFAEFFTDPTFPQIELERGIIMEECLEDLNAEGINVDINNIACDPCKLNPVADFIEMTEVKRDPARNTDNDLLQGKGYTRACDSNGNGYTLQFVTEYPSND